MIQTSEILDTLRMIDREKLDVRTITMGISLFPCVSDDIGVLCRRVYDRITRKAERLVAVGEEIEREFGVPIVNKRISVTPAALILGSAEDPVPLARALDDAAKATGVDFIGGYSALVQKGMTDADRRLYRVHSRGACQHGLSLFLGERGLHARRHRHGRGGAPGAGDQKDRRTDQRQRTALAAPNSWPLPTPWRTTPSWPRLPRPRRGRRSHQRGRQRPGRGQKRPGGRAGRAL